MRRISSLPLLGYLIIILLLSSCSYKTTQTNNLVVANKSSEIITNISIQRTNKTNILGSYLKPNQHSFFNMGVQKNCTYRVEFEDKNNQSTLSNEFTSNFNQDEMININILKDNSGEWSIILRN